MLIAANHLYDVNELKIMLRKEFDMKNLGADKKILGMETRRDMIENYNSKIRYVAKVLYKFDMSNSKAVDTPLVNHFKLSLDQCLKTCAKVEYMSKVP